MTTPIEQSFVSILNAKAKEAGYESFDHAMKDTQAESYNVINRIITAAAERYKEQGRWIDVKDSRPEIGEIVVMVLTDIEKSKAFTGFRANGGWYFFQIGEQAKTFLPNDHPYMKITHWQPLPQPPTI